MKIIERIVESTGEPNKNDLWLDTKSDKPSLKMYAGREWVEILGCQSSDGGSGSSGGGSDDFIDRLITNTRFEFDESDSVESPLGYEGVFTLLVPKEDIDLDIWKLIEAQEVASIRATVTVTDDDSSYDYVTVCSDAGIEVISKGDIDATLYKYATQNGVVYVDPENALGISGFTGGLVFNISHSDGGR